MSTKNTLLIPLIGPLQSWGSRSHFDDRDTHLEPTKSGIIGLVCAAIGRPRGESVGDLTALRFGVRVDSPGRVMDDFHTAQFVYRAGGGADRGNVTSHRAYLTDAAFLAAFEGDDHDVGLLRQIDAALRDPVWILALGRKSCVLAVPPYLPEGSLRIGADINSTFTEEPWRPITLPKPWEDRPDALRVVLEDPNGHAQASDQPISIAERTFGLRRFTISYVPRPPREEPWCTYH